MNRLLRLLPLATNVKISNVFKEPHLRKLPLIALIAIMLAPLSWGQTQHGGLVSWTAPTGSDAAVGYFIYRATVSTGPFTQIDTTEDTSTSYLDTTIAANTTYYYYAVAVDASGNQSAPSNTATLAVGALVANPGSPTGCNAKQQ